MLGQATLILGLVGVGLLVLYFANTLDRERHFLLVLLTVFIFSSILLLIPKALIDNKDNCDIVVSNSTINSSTNQTSYQYEYFCNTNTKQTAETFNLIVLWFVRLFVTYIGVYYLYIVYMKLMEWAKEKRWKK